jgi:F0F1-type ATP synthase alpha subunit
MKSKHKALVNEINKTGNFSDDISGRIRAAIDAFVKTQSW